MFTLGDVARHAKQSHGPAIGIAQDSALECDPTLPGVQPPNRQPAPGGVDPVVACDALKPSDAGVKEPQIVWIDEGPRFPLLRGGASKLCP